MAKSHNSYRGKHALVLDTGTVKTVLWLLDQGAKVTITDRAGIRSIQGHLRSVAADGDDYERRKKQLAWVSEDEAEELIRKIDVVVSALPASKNSLVRQAHAQGIPIVGPKVLAKAPAIPSRQEVVYQSSKLLVVDDSGAIGPERGIMSLRQWGGPNCILIAGGEGRFDYTAWADEIAETIRPTNTIFITGSATDKMRKALGLKRARGIRTYDALSRAWHHALARARKFVSAVILFSPAAKSSGLFLSDHDRSQQFNNLIKNFERR